MQEYTLKRRAGGEPETFIQTLSFLRPPDKSSGHRLLQNSVSVEERRARLWSEVPFGGRADDASFPLVQDESNTFFSLVEQLVEQ